MNINSLHTSPQEVGQKASLLITKETFVPRLISTVFSPLLMPTYGILLAIEASVMCFLPLSTRLIVVASIFGITCVAPLLFITLLYILKVVSDFGLNNRRERVWPYAFMVCSYFTTASYLVSHHSPDWLVHFVWGALAAVVLSMAINAVWKISGHAAGISGIIAMLIYMQNQGLVVGDITTLICVLVIVAGAIGTSRLILGKHTLWQVAAGAANGFLCVWGACTLF